MSVIKGVAPGISRRASLFNEFWGKKPRSAQNIGDRARSMPLGSRLRACQLLRRGNCSFEYRWRGSWRGTLLAEGLQALLTRVTVVLGFR